MKLRYKRPDLDQLRKALIGVKWGVFEARSTYRIKAPGQTHGFRCVIGLQLQRPVITVISHGQYVAMKPLPPELVPYAGKLRPIRVEFAKDLAASLERYFDIYTMIPVSNYDTYRALLNDTIIKDEPHAEEPEVVTVEQEQEPPPWC